MAETRPIPFAPGYFVSDDGRVFSEKNGVRRELKPGITNGYKYVNLRIDGRSVKATVHRIVARTFLGEPVGTMDVRHLDGSRDNNRVTNLAWGTRSDNMYDAVRHGRNPQHLYPERAARGDRHPTRTKPEVYRRGSGCHQAKLTEADVLRIRERLAAGVTQASLAAEYGVSAPAIGYIARGQSWKHVSSPDMSRRTERSGQNSVHAKLTAEQVEQMRAMSRDGASVKDLAERFGVTYENARLVVRGETWKRVALHS